MPKPPSTYGSIAPGGGITAVGPTGAPTWHIRTLLTWGDDLFYTHDKHAFKFGGLINYHQEPNTMQKLTYGSITFSNVSSFKQGIPTPIGAVQPAPTFLSSPGSLTLGPPYNSNYLERDFHFKTMGFYIQDDYRWQPRVTLNLGLRYEFMTTPQDVNGRQSYIPQLTTSTTYALGPILNTANTYRNFSPRVGFAWDVFGTGRTTVSHSLQYNLTLEQQIPWGMGVSVSYVGNHGINHLYTDMDGNPVAATGTDSPWTSDLRRTKWSGTIL